MENSDKNEKKQISRRGFLPLLGGGILFPLIGFGKTPSVDLGDEEYQIMLKPDGTTVKVKKSILDKSEVVEKNISNKSLLGWLKNK